MSKSDHNFDMANKHLVKSSRAANGADLMDGRNSSGEVYEKPLT